MSSEPVLFISHDATRTGAPMVLLHFLRWLSINTDIPFEILLAAGGDLQPEFEALGPVSVLPDEISGSRFDRFAKRISRRRVLRTLMQNRGLIVSNTITNGLLVNELSRGRRPVISYIHELDTTIQSYGAENLRAVLRQTTGYVACCEAVRANLVNRHGVCPASIDVVHEFVPVPSYSGHAPSDRQQILDEIGIPAGALIVGASGTTDWRKGTDLFVLLAQAVAAKRPDLPIHFIWVGGAQPDSTRHRELQHDITLLGLASRVHFVGTKANPLDYFRAFDVFALTSREDPYPLVCLEAASLAKPIVCFDGAGGEPEFIEDDCGFSVPYLDVEAMASQLVGLLESGDLRRQMGGRAAAKVRERHDVAVSAPSLLSVIERYRR